MLPNKEVPAFSESGGKWKSFLERIELPVGVIISLQVLLLHGLFLFNAGPLWRDDVGTIDFATMPTLRDMWQNMPYDNFPPLFLGVARTWAFMGLSSDFGYRILGFFIGIGTLGAIWFCGRCFASSLRFWHWFYTHCLRGRFGLEIPCGPMGWELR